jgi:leucyl aminopeptidase (aminopeptidase T)
MKNYEEIVGEAVRIEYTEQDGKLYIVFEILNEKYKQDIIRDWTKDIEFRLKDKQLIKEE